MSISTYLAAGALGVALAPAAANAGSILLADFGSRAAGRGTAVVAVGEDPSTIYYNPAGIAFLPNAQLELGAELISPRWQWTPVGGGDTVKTESGIVVPPFLSASFNLGDVGLGDLAAGLGFYVPYGSTFAWPADWPGAQEIRKISLQVAELNPVLAWRPVEYLSIGAGFRYLPAGVFLSRAVRFGSEREGSLEMAGRGTGYGFNAGVLFKGQDSPIAIGASFRSGPKITFAGDANFDFPAEFADAGVDRDVTAELATGHVVRFGAAFEALPDRLKLSVDIERQLWSRYESLRIVLKNADGTETVSESRRDSRDTWVLHVGGNVKATDALEVRAGYVIDSYTLPEETVNPAPPDSTRHVVTLGLSYVLGDFGGVRDLKVHTHVADVFFVKRTSTTSRFPGVWEGAYAFGSSAYLWTLSLSGSFDLGAARSAWAGVAGGGEPKSTHASAQE